MWALDIEEVDSLMLKYRQETDEFLICSEESGMLFQKFAGSVHSEGTVSYSRILFFFLPDRRWL